MSKKNKGFGYWILKLLKWFIFSIIFLCILGAGGGFLAYLYFSNDLPKLDKIEDYRPKVMSEVFDDQGNKIGEFWIEDRILTPIDQIPDLLIKAFVASEDERFFEHKGVDPIGIGRAFMSNLKTAQVSQGASTITQQVVKSLVLTPERTYERKIKEAILATKLERNLNKDQILYIYLNQIYFGNRAHGVTAAAKNYFHKDLKDLNLAEMAMIASLAKGPSKFNPIVNPDRARRRMQYVLNRMAELNFVKAEDAEAAKNIPLNVYKAGIAKEFNKKYLPYFVEGVRRELEEKYGSEKLNTLGWKIYTTANLEMGQKAQKAVANGVKQFSKTYGYRGPLKHLDSDQDIESFLKEQNIRLLDEQEAINYFQEPKELQKSQLQPAKLFPDRTYEAVISSINSDNIIIKVGQNEGTIDKKNWPWAQRPARKKKKWDPQRGDVVEVRLMKEQINTTKPTALSSTNSKFNFILFQTPAVESALYSYEPFTGEIKAIIGGQDFEKSEFNRATQALLQPGSTIKPLIYSSALDKGYTPQTTIMDAPIVHQDGPGKFWRPKNAGGKYNGPMSLRSALIASKNVVTVRIVMDIGTHYVTGFMRKMGLKTPIHKFYSMALGANEVRLAEIARAYGTFATGGILPKTHSIRKIVDLDGKVIEEYQPLQTPYSVKWKEIKEAEIKNQTISAEKKVNSKKEENNSSTKIPPEPKTFKSWEGMGYNDQLFSEGQEYIKQDDLLLEDYEKKALFGAYIPDGYTISPLTATTMVGILRGVVTSGTGRRANALGQEAAGKTGTTNDNTDAWFIGFTPNLVTGVWVGFGEKRRSLGRGREGGNTAAPIWLDYMKDAVKRYPVMAFENTLKVDVAKYKTPNVTVPAVFDQQLDIEVPDAGPSGSSPSSADFFTTDLE